MKKILKNWILLFILINLSSGVQAGNDKVFVDRMIMGDKINGIADTGLPKKDIWTFQDTDQTILFYAKIGVINPVVKVYNIEYTCTDRAGNLIIKGAIENKFNENTTYHLGSDLLSSQTVIIQLNPKPNALVKGQVIPLEDGKEYFIKLYFNNKLIGITEFAYIINK